jgi:hypothetical protein
LTNGLNCFYLDSLSQSHPLFPLSFVVSTILMIFQPFETHTHTPTHTPGGLRASERPRRGRPARDRALDASGAARHARGSCATAGMQIQSHTMRQYELQLCPSILTHHCFPCSKKRIQNQQYILSQVCRNIRFITLNCSVYFRRTLSVPSSFADLWFGAGQRRVPRHVSQRQG